MIKTVLLPTDFSIESLNLLKASARLDVGKVRVVFYHSFVLSASITELLFFSKTKTIESLVRPDFWNAVKIIRNKYSSVFDHIEVDLFVGRNGAAFENFVLGNRADYILIPEHYVMQHIHERSDDPIKYIGHCKGVTIHRMHWTIDGNIPEKNLLSEIFQPGAPIEINKKFTPYE